MRPFSRIARQTPRIARLSPSVPPEVKQISSLRAPRQRRYALARFIECSARFASPPVRAGRVSEARPEERAHRFENLVTNRRGRGMIEIDWARCSSL